MYYRCDNMSHNPSGPSSSKILKANWRNFGINWIHLTRVGRSWISVHCEIIEELIFWSNFQKMGHYKLPTWVKYLRLQLLGGDSQDFWKKKHMYYDKTHWDEVLIQWIHGHVKWIPIHSYWWAYFKFVTSHYQYHIWVISEIILVWK